MKKWYPHFVVLTLGMSLSSTVWSQDAGSTLERQQTGLNYTADDLADPEKRKLIQDDKRLDATLRMREQNNARQGERPEDFRFFKCVERFSENQLQELDRIQEANTKAQNGLMDLTNQRFNLLAQERNDLREINRSYQEQQRDTETEIENLVVTLDEQKNTMLAEKNRIEQTCKAQSREALANRRQALMSGEAVVQGYTDLAGTDTRSENRYSQDVQACLNDNVPAFEELKRRYMAATKALQIREKRLNRNLNQMLENAKMDQAMVQYNRAQGVKQLDFQTEMIKYTQQVATNDTKRVNIQNQILSGWGCLDERNQIKKAQDRYGPANGSTGNADGL